MAIYVNELSIWDNNVPVITIGDGEFSTWDDDVPLVDQDEGIPNSTSNRRRSDIF